MSEQAERKQTTKSRILFLLQYLREYTDDNHHIKTNDLIKVLAENGFAANRKTVKDDMDMLSNAGYDVQSYRPPKDKRTNYYHLGARTFETAELRMLVDAVSSSRFISAEKSDLLISKLSSMASKYQAEKLKAKILTADRIKADNGKVLYITDAVSQAIDKEKKIAFQYYDYLPDKKKVLRNDGEVYVLSPYALIWSEDRYYLVGFSDKRQEIVQFRVDRMKMPEILEEPAVQDTSFNPAEYVKEVMYMYPGQEQLVKLICENDKMRSVIDRFGLDIQVSTVDEQHFSVEVKVHTSPTFYGWVFQFCGDIEIAGPAEVRDEYLSMAERVASTKRV